MFATFNSSRPHRPVHLEPFCRSGSSRVIPSAFPPEQNIPDSACLSFSLHLFLPTWLFVSLLGFLHLTSLHFPFLVCLLPFLPASILPHTSSLPHSLLLLFSLSISSLLTPSLPRSFPLSLYPHLAYLPYLRFVSPPLCHLGTWLDVQTEIMSL